MALLGDAGCGATMGGMGTGVAVVGAHVLAGELALAGGDHRRAFAEYESRIRSFAKGCQNISGNAGPFFAPPAGVYKRLTEKAATGIRLRSYPA